jgi:hypothetical protein
MSLEDNVYYIENNNLSLIDSLIGPLNEWTYDFTFFQKSIVTALHKNVTFLLDFKFVYDFYNNNKNHKFFKQFNNRCQNNIILKLDHKINIDVASDFLSKIINQYTISEGNLYIILQYSSDSESLKNKLISLGHRKVNVTFNMNWLVWTINNLRNNNTNLAITPEKKFSIFSRRFSNFRKDLYIDMLSKNILDNSIYTFSNRDPYHKDTVTISEMVSNIPSKYEFCKDKILNWLKNVPYETSDYYNPVSDQINEKLLKSHINIVLETCQDDYYYSDISCVYLTEKTFKSIVLQRPFVILGNYKSLSFLREQGFKTFSPYINEDYDSIQLTKYRLPAVIDELDRINKLSDSDFNKLIENCKDICKFNYDVAMHYLNKDFPKSFANIRLIRNK